MATLMFIVIKLQTVILNCKQKAGKALLNDSTEHQIQSGQKSPG